MSLHQDQSYFALAVSMLIQEIARQGYTCSLGEVYRPKEQALLMAQQGKGIKDSQHCKRLAIDINLFKNNNYLTQTKDYEPLGIYWESLDPHCRWGGYFVSKYGGSIVDGCHFEWKE